MEITKISSEKTESSVIVRKNKKKSVLKQIKNSWQLYVLFFLPFVYIIIFHYIPMYGVTIAFKSFNPVQGILGSPWIGFDHFIRFFNSYEFWRVIKNTLILSFYQLIAGFPFPIILALSLNYVNKKRFKKTVQMVSYAPHFISVVVMVGIIFVFLEPRGPINGLLTLLGFESVHFMGNPDYFKSIYVWSGIWQSVGFSCIIYLAALSSISPALHEAAVIDGASKLQRIWHIDIPGILPITIILLILDMGNILNVGFEKALLLQNPLNLKSSEIIDTYVYKVGLVSAVPNYSYAAAIGLFKSIIGLILIYSVNKFAKKVGQESLW
ncbi:ABC transporter permease [Lederbergia wuyishanensis]|uniref:Multiple sugar transport system permease protein/putative aldouronate transport system permease protein n=1 Tax=Lederbergia wuyishanensis TaxID=1347903 RepID=A0ABU0D461_9BACI|nr:ABC transporter permease subunit [Lederbergia wuyishanensis]MCJ8008237.1 ABC transporter permease subunit [Lederbergia wuyishanensis]MDQ0343174.1 multiple sugar transport system permease protein/putative aldouronate transport system permease protein [Lederbergia wuyishanensis]